MGSTAAGGTNVSTAMALSSFSFRSPFSSFSTVTYWPFWYSYPDTMSSFSTSPWTGHTFLYRMRSLHPLWRRWNPIFPLVAPTALNALTGMDTRLNVRCPSQLGRVAMPISSGRRPVVDFGRGTADAMAMPGVGGDHQLRRRAARAGVQMGRVDWLCGRS